MMELHAFGGLALQGVTLSLQPKRLALLCYLTLARPRGIHRRDSLLALFWPELDASHARQALRQALTALRSLDDPLVLTRGDEEVQVVADRVHCDVLAFERAVEEEQLERALELYAGPLLHGFFLADCPEFERWVEGERQRLQTVAAEAGWRLADRESGQNPVAAARWARLAAGYQPDDEAAVRRLITILDRAGDRAGALREYERLAERLREEFQAEPAPETQALVSALRVRRATDAQDLLAQRERLAAPVSRFPQSPTDQAPPLHSRARKWHGVAMQGQRTVELFPDYGFEHEYLSWVYDAKGMYEESLAAQQEAVRLMGDADVNRKALLGRAYARAGRRDDAMQILVELLRLQRTSYVHPALFAYLYIGLGQTDEAIDWLQRGYAARDPDMVFLNTFPPFDPLRPDPRFEDLVRQMNFPH